MLDGRRRFASVFRRRAQLVGVRGKVGRSDERHRSTDSNPPGSRACSAPFGASMKGLPGAYRERRAFRQELALAVVVIPLGLWLGRNGIERALLIAPMFLVLIVELLNSAHRGHGRSHRSGASSTFGSRQGHRVRGGTHVTAAACGDLDSRPVALSR